MSVLADRINERMTALGITANALSSAVASRDVVRMILSGRSKQPGMATLNGLARELQCDVRYLMGQVDDPRGVSRDSPAFAVATTSPGRVRLTIDTETSMGVAAQILALIEGDKP